MTDAFEHGSQRARHTKRGRRSEVRLGQAPMGSEVRNWRMVKTRRATSPVHELRGESQANCGRRAAPAGSEVRSWGVHETTVSDTLQ